MPTFFDNVLNQATQVKAQVEQKSTQLEQAIEAQLVMQAALLGVGIYIAILLTKRIK